METNFSVGTYSVAENGISVNYTCPAILSKEMMEKISPSQDREEKIPVDNTFDTLLKGVISVPKPNK